MDFIDPCHTPTLAKTYQNGSFWSIFEFLGKAYPYSASKHSSILQNSQKAPPILGSEAQSSHRGRARAVCRPTHDFAKRRKEPKEEKVRYKSLRTASRPLKEVLGYLEGSDECVCTKHLQLTTSYGTRRGLLACVICVYHVHPRYVRSFFR